MELFAPADHSCIEWPYFGTLGHRPDFLFVFSCIHDREMSFEDLVEMLTLIWAYVFLFMVQLDVLVTITIRIHEIAMFIHIMSLVIIFVSIICTI